MNPYSYNYSRFHFRINPDKTMFRVLRIHCNPDHSIRLEYINLAQQHPDKNFELYLSNDLEWISFNESIDKIPTAFADLIIVFNATSPAVSRFDWLRILNTNALLALVENKNTLLEREMFEYFQTNGFQESKTHQFSSCLKLFLFRKQQIVCCGN